MGRGYVVGLLAGALFSSVSVSALSLMMPPVAPLAPPEAVKAEPITPAPVPVETPPAEIAAETPPAEVAAETPPAEVAAAEAPSAPAAAAPAEPAAEPEPAPAPEPAAAPEPAPAAPAPTPEPAPAATAPAPETETAAVAPQPEAPVVEVPAGSEFNRAKPEETPVLPAPQPAPAASAAPAVVAPSADSGPALTELLPAAPPESPASAPAALPEPAPQPEAIAEAPAGDTAVPVPPPGEAVLPDLAPAAPETETAEATAPEPQPVPEAAPAATPEPEAAPEGEIVDESVPEPEPEIADESVPEPEPEAEVAEPLPQIITPAPEAQPETDQAIVPAPDEGASAAIRPRIITPGAGRTTEDGPVIIDVAPAPPIGASSGPAVGFTQKVPGVQVNRLPRIGVTEPAPATDAADPAAAAEAAPDTAVARFGAAFANPESKPIIAVVLTDDGSGADAEAVAAIGAPVTIALDPEKPGVAVLAQTYRLSGDEVAILAPAMPEGSTPSDLEVSYQGYVQTLPESVALVAGPGSALQSDRRIAQHIASLLASEGRGLVTAVRGLNAGRQAAERAGAAYAGITRLLDEEGQDEAAMKRLLDRAAFDAARGGDIVILGKATPETVAALRGWIEAGQKDAVIGPLSAVLAP